MIGRKWFSLEGLDKRKGCIKLRLKFYWENITSATALRKMDFLKCHLGDVWGSCFSVFLHFDLCHWWRRNGFFCDSIRTVNKNHLLTKFRTADTDTQSLSSNTSNSAIEIYNLSEAILQMQYTFSFTHGVKFCIPKVQRWMTPSDKKAPFIKLLHELLLLSDMKYFFFA